MSTTPTTQRFIDVPNLYGGSDRTEVNHALRRAAYQNDHDTLSAALAAGADPNHQDAWERTALHAAADGHGTDAVRFLLDHGADPNARDNNGDGPLHLASRSGVDSECVQALLEGGANPNLTNHRGETPLFEAPLTETVDLLADYGVDMNAQDRDGNTALHRQAKNQMSGSTIRNLQMLGEHGVIPPQDHLLKPGVMDRLIERGADPMVRNAQGQTAQDVLPEGRTIPAIERRELHDAADAEQIEAPRRQRARL